MNKQDKLWIFANVHSFGAVKVVHFKSSDKHEPNLSDSEQKWLQIDLKYVGG